MTDSSAASGSQEDNVALLREIASRGLDGLLGLQIDSVDLDRLVAVIDLDERHRQPHGIVHGGVYCAIGESAASVSAFHWLTATGIGGTAVGVNNNTDFLRSIEGGRVVATSTPIHRGRRQQLWEVNMVDDRDRLLARTQVRLQNIEMPAETTGRAAGGSATP